MSCSATRRPMIGAALCVLCLVSGSVRAEGDPVSAMRWPQLPIWGAEAEARGYQVPYPFGVGVSVYAARQPVNIQDLQLARHGPPVSVKDFLQIDTVNTSQQNVAAKFDVLIFPFLSVYALGGYTMGTTKGAIQVAPDPILGIIESRVLQLDAKFSGPTYGAGLTVQGGSKISDWHDLMAIGVADWNRTQTKLTFENESVVADTKPIASVFSARLGVHFTAGTSMGGAVWAGAMHQDIQQEIAGSVANTDLQFIVVQSPRQPWSTLIGGLWEFGKDGYVLVEGGVGARKSILASAVYRF